MLDANPAQPAPGQPPRLTGGSARSEGPPWPSSLKGLDQDCGRPHYRLVNAASHGRVMTVPLVALVCGALLSVSLGVYGAKHEPTSQAITTLGFGSLIEMKVWLAVVRVSSHWSS